MITAYACMFVGVLLFCLHYVRNIKHRGRLPSGPRGLPVIVNLLRVAMGGSAHLKLTEWSKQYGKLYTVYVANTPVVVLNDLDVMKDVLGTIAATGRINSEIICMIMWSGPHGLIATEGKEWQEQKQFCIRALRDFGFGRQAYMEPMIAEETEKLCKWIDSSNNSGDNTLFLDEHILRCAGSIMWGMLTGKPGKEDELQASRITILLKKWVNLLPIVYKRGLAIFPWIKYIAPVRSGYQEFAIVCKEVREYVEHHFEEHGRTRKNGEPPRDMIDAYIEKVETCQDKSSTFYGDSGWKHSYASLVILMIASVDSTGNMLTWLIYYLCAHSEVQLALQREIDQVLGTNRNPGYDDMPNMPYLKAVILETLRFTSFNPIGGLIKLLEDVSSHGYCFPTGTVIVPNLYAVHNDKSIWGDPENFRPARFLEKGSENLKEFVVAFQPGRRACPGEHFAKSVLFLFAAKLFQKYTFSPDPDLKNVEKYFEPISGFVLKPQNLGVVVTPRNR